MRKLIVIILLTLCSYSQATDTFLRYSAGSLVVVDGVIQVGAGSTGWTDTNDTLEAVWYMDDRQPILTIETSASNLTDTILVDGVAEDTSPRYSGIGRGFYFPQGGYVANTNVSDTLGASVTALSMWCWIELDASVIAGNWGVLDLGTLARSGAGMAIAHNASVWRFIIGGNFNSSPVATSTNRTFLAQCWDGTNSISYVNGSPVLTNSHPSAIDASSMSFNLGTYYTGAFRTKGEIDKPALYNRYVTPSEISALYAQGEADFTLDSVGSSGLVVAYEMTNDILRANSPFQEPFATGWGIWPTPSHANSPTFQVVFGTNSNGRVLKGATFDTTDDKLEATLLPTSPTTNDFIITDWIYFNDVSNGDIVGFAVNANDSAGMFMYNSKLYFRVRVGGSIEEVITANNMVTGQWYNVAGRYQHGGESSLWLNGVKESALFTNSATLAVQDVWEIGGGTAMKQGTVRYYQGTSDTNIIMDVLNNTAPPNGDIEIRRTQE